MSVRILHAADLHLDSPFEALSGAQAAQRRREQRDLLRALPELARAHGAQIILLAGDLLDSGSPYPETAKALAETFAGCASEVFLAPGNHDYYSAGAPYARLTFPENVHIFRTQRIEAVALPEGAARNICRIVLTGETDRAPNPAALRAALEGQVFAMQLRDETRACRDLWARAGEGTLRGQFLAQLKQKYDAADSDRDRETIVMAARWGLAALDHDEEVATL